MSAEAHAIPIPTQPEGEQSPEFSYTLLTGHARTDGSHKATEQLHSEYVRLTDDLVHKMADGVEAVNPKTGETTTEKVDMVVWLDKSARPVAWLTHDLWPTLAADAEGNVPKEPEHKFVNIDRNQWTSSIDPEGSGTSDVQRIDQSVIRSLRSIFLANPKDKEQGLVPAIDNAPTVFDGKTVLIVDELMSTGRTLNYAKQFFMRAFPDAKIATAYWMKGISTKNGGLSKGNADVPVWYRDDTPYGRGVGNRNIDLSLDSKNTTQRLGAWFLSVALREADPLTQRLRSELHQLAEDARNGEVLIEPSRQRDMDDYDERAMRLNHVSNMDEYIALRNQKLGNKK